ncbi:nucleotidyltransferase family protein [Streptacidiphilus cavernicola]|uniref:Nucleotidyltransferase family protein n=1 Tax=Streptacidiphilus cavernicola TaxID=3342716 RepID=A0ABV6VVN6_9ACTN
MSEPMNQDRLTALRSLSSLQPLLPVEQSVAAVEAVGGVAAAGFLELLRMRSLVMRRLAPFQEHHPEVRACMAAMRPKADSIRHMHAVLGENLARLDRIGRDAGIELFGGKGLGARATYADASVRDFSDLDIFVRTRADATRLVHALRDGFGYQYLDRELPWFKYDPEEELLYGQFPLVAPDGDTDLLNVDIHFGDYSVRYSSRLGLTPTLPDRGPGLHTVPVEENLACVVNNAAGDFFVTAKDTNDLLMALSQPELDIERLALRLKQAGLDAFFGFICAELKASSVLTPEQQERFDRLPAVAGLEPSPRPDRPDWELRCLATVVHTFAAHEGQGRTAALRTSMDAYDYYRGPLVLSLAGADSAPAPVIGLNPWSCVRLVPVPFARRLLDGAPVPADRADGRSAPERRTAIAGDPDVERVDLPEGTFVRIADEVFVATVWYELSPDVIAGAERESAALA